MWFIIKDRKLWVNEEGKDHFNSKEEAINLLNFDFKIKSKDTVTRKFSNGWFEHLIKDKENTNIFNILDSDAVEYLGYEHLLDKKR